MDNSKKEKINEAIKEEQAYLKSEQEKYNSKKKETRERIVTNAIHRVTNWELLWKIIKICYFQWFVLGYFALIVIFGTVLYIVEPSFNTIGDGLWYCFAVVTTIGFGDLVATTITGKILTVILGIISVVIMALISGIIIDFIQEKFKTRRDESIVVMMDKLENLPDLSPEVLAELSEQIKKIDR